MRSPQPLGRVGPECRLASELRQLGGGDRHPEERDREQRQELGVAQHRHGLGRDERGVVGVHQRADLDDATGHQDRQEAAQHRAHRRAGGVERRPEPPQQRPEHRELHRELEHAPRHHPPGEERGQPVLVDPRAGNEQDRDLRQVPHHRRGVGEEELPVAVEHPQAPGREHQQPRAREEDAGQLHRLGEGGRPGLDEARPPRRRRSTGRRRCPGRPAPPPGSEQQPEHRAGHPVGVLAAALAEEPGVDRDEGGGEHPLAEEVLQDVGDAERGGEGAGQRRGAQVVGEDPLADQPHQPRGEDAQRHQRGAPARAPGWCGGVGHGRRGSRWRTLGAGTDGLRRSS